MWTLRCAFLECLFQVDGCRDVDRVCAMTKCRNAKQSDFVCFVDDTAQRLQGSKGEREREREFSFRG